MEIAFSIPEPLLIILAIVFGIPILFLALVGGAFMWNFTKSPFW